MRDTKLKIKDVNAWEILDSRGNPTVRVCVVLDNGVEGIASVPSGASTGMHEALELRDGDRKRYDGKGVLKAVANVNKIIAPLLYGFIVTKQKEIDETMVKLDGTENKSRLGANAILGVSLACAHAAANALRRPLYKYIRATYNLQATTYKLPYPTMNVLNGGRHADWAADIQEFMIIPLQKKFSERVRCGAEIFHALHDVLKKHGYPVSVGDEGGYAPRLKNNEEAFKLLAEAVDKAGYNTPGALKLGIDAAASEFFNKKTRKYEMNVDKKNLDARQLGGLYLKWARRYPLISIEDPFAEDDWDSWVEFIKTLKHENIKTLIVGDDLFVTNVKRLQKGIQLKAANAILIKLNQIGTLSETIDTIALAQKHGYKISVSHRSGETMDTTIADLAVAVNADYIKTGSLSRSERVEKYNRLMEIEDELINSK